MKPKRLTNQVLEQVHQAAHYKFVNEGKPAELRDNLFSAYCLAQSLSDVLGLDLKFDFKRVSDD